MPKFHIFYCFQIYLNYKMSLMTIGAGCFWCVEAIFNQIAGVSSVTSGYSGGDLPNPNYEMICTGKSGYAEVIQVEFDSNIVSYEELLKLFWISHDPTTINQQGNDIGSQYRSVIFFHNQNQKNKADSLKKALNESNLFKKEIVTEITEFKKFYKAEEYHQDYFAKNPNVPYCSFVIKPKLEKFLINYKKRESR